MHIHSSESPQHILGLSFLLSPHLHYQVALLSQHLHTYLPQYFTAITATTTYAYNNAAWKINLQVVEC